MEDVSGVRITPNKIEFKDTTVKERYTVNITVKNVSSTSKSIRYYAPQTKKFKLNVKNPERPVAPGLEVPATVEYFTTEPVNATDRIVVTVDGDVIEVPLYGLPAQPEFELETPADFGFVVLAAKTIQKEIILRNHGALAGRFGITYEGDGPVSIIPNKGSLPAHSEIPIRVEYVTRRPGEFYDEARVELQGKSEPVTLQIKGCVVERTLELLDQNQQKIECLRFGATYYGTDRTEWAYLYNNSPEPLNFVCILDENAVGQELGVDLTMSTAATLNQKLQPKNPGQLNAMNSLVSVVPNEGVLNPYDRMMVCFRFSPRWTPSKQGFKCSVKPPPRQDFALFMRFMVVGAKTDLAEREENSKEPQSKSLGDVHAELAITATALPVLLSVNPTGEFKFGECPLNERIDTMCSITNSCHILPITYQFRRIAHFRAHPSEGNIKPGKSTNIIFSFQPNQYGKFNMTQNIDVLGEVADFSNPFQAFLEVINSTPVQFVAGCDPQTKLAKPRLNLGITPKLTNETGLNAEMTFTEGYSLNPKGAVAAAQQRKMIGHKSAPIGSRGVDADDEDDSLIAFPNDRYASLRPTQRNKKFKTIFTRKERHNYVDPDYSYTDEEMAAIEAHRKFYKAQIDKLREDRQERRRVKEHKQFNDDTNIGIKVAAGLMPRRLSISDIKDDPRPPTPPNSNWKLTSSKELEELASKTMDKQILEGLKAIPQTDQEKKECSAYLTPSDLHKIVIGPSFIDFGEVCIRSINTKYINIVNNLESHIHVQVTVDCQELRQTSPLSQVVPPMAKAVVPIIFQQDKTKGKFQRSINYSINGFYKNHVTVVADVVSPTLIPSTTRLEVESIMGLPAEAGMRGVVTLRNPLNYPAEFFWSPIVGERGTAFSIRPAAGTVEAFQELDCEVVFHPSYLAPLEGQFHFKTHGSKQIVVECVAKFGPTNVQFIERRVMFGVVPLNLTTIKCALLYNGSSNHAYFQVLDPNPFQGLTVTPIQGVVPVGGKAELKIILSPNALIKFDTRIQVAIRGWKTMELRVGGTVEPPCVDINLNNFHLGGVPCGSQKRHEFELINRTKTRTRCEFDLSRYEDFGLEFPDTVTPADLTFQARNPGFFTVTLEGEQVIKGYLVFSPTEVAAYDFVLPVSINAVGAPSPTNTPIPPTPAPSNKNTIHNIINPKPVPVMVATPCKRVICTALRQPLQLSRTELKFELTTDFYDMAAESNQNGAQKKSVMLANVSDRVLQWSIDLNNIKPTIPSEHDVSDVFRFVRPSGAPFLSHASGGVNGKLDPGETFQLGIFFCPAEPAIYNTRVPLLINGDTANPYTYITMQGELQKPVVTFEPKAIVITPVPLSVTGSTQFIITLSSFRKKSEIRCSLPEVECDDGSLSMPLRLLNGDGTDFESITVIPKDDDSLRTSINLRVEFSCERPISFSDVITFTDSSGHTYKLPITATADNSLLTCYPFIAQHRLDHQIVCEEGKTLRSLRTQSATSRSVGEPIIMSIDSPIKSRPSTSATVSQFEISSSSYESTASATPDENGLHRHDEPNRAGAVNNFGKSDSQMDAARRSLGSNVFPDEESEEGIFHQEVLLAVQRWFSANGWPGGAYPIRIPDSLRSGVTKQSSNEKSDNTIRKDLKTIYDMIFHMAGRAIPGIPMNGTLPRDPTERVRQVHWQHQTMLTFIKNQGGCIASIKPEYLMEPGDYKHWKWVQELQAVGGDVAQAAKALPSEEEVQIADSVFEAISKRAWTEVLLQLWKTMELGKITLRHLKTMKLPHRDLAVPAVNPDPLCSNIYSVPERIVLSWLNHLFENYKDVVWVKNEKGGVPNSRWLVNFDYDLLDGLVIGAILGAYCPFLISTHLNEMYTKPETAEHCLHNALKVVNAMRYIGMDYDIQAIDITDPNPVSMMMLCVYLYNKLPLYIPKSTLEFSGTLHQAVQRQIKLNNPSATKSLLYQPVISGFDSLDYRLPDLRNNIISIPPKGELNLHVEFKSRFLRTAEAMLILVGHRVGSASGTTLVFKLVSHVDDIQPMLDTKRVIDGTQGVVKEDSPAYELHKIEVDVTNPFSQEGEFRVVIVEAMEQHKKSKDKSKQQNMSRQRKPKRVRSKVNHGQRQAETPSPPPAEKSETVTLARKPANQAASPTSNSMSAFFCPAESVYLKAKETRKVQIHFLPFNTGKYQCSVILMNEKVGEFLYIIDAKAILPKVSALPFKAGPNSVRISSAAAASSGMGMFGGRDDVIYWKCEVGRPLDEMLSIPMTNVKREEALITAAHQQMTEMEYERRRVTGTLNSSTITTKAIELLTMGKQQTLSHLQKQPMARHHKGTSFKVTLDSKYFSAPTTVTLPHPSQVKSSASTKLNHNGMVLDDGSIDLPIRFQADKPGHYPCKIVLEAPDDIRVYQVECTVNPAGSSAQLEVTAPVHQSVIQNIPIINSSKHDWYLDAIIRGMGFLGPQSIIAKAMQITQYPLTFRPGYEGAIHGSLLLENKADCHEHLFELIGKATEPLPLDKIVIKGTVNSPWSRIVDVPNITKKKLIYRVETDIPFLGGRPVITVLEGQLGKYELTALPRRRGKTTGVMAFVAGRNPIIHPTSVSASRRDIYTKHRENFMPAQYDSDGDEIVSSDHEDDEYDGYKVWYSVVCDVVPAPPERTLSIRCNCQKRAVVEIAVNNPTCQDIKLDVEIFGMGLEGPKEVMVAANNKAVYELVFFPKCIGETKGSIIFYHDTTGEFWYDIDLFAENPAISNLPTMSCELGRWCQQFISLTNPTDKTLEFVPTVSNANNYSLVRNDQRPIVIRAHETVKVPLNFMPSSLGDADHKAKITFHSEEFGEWTFTVNGTGTLPQPQDVVSLSCVAGSNTTIIIPFRNPLDEPVIVDVKLTDRSEMEKGLNQPYKEVQYHSIFHPEDLPVGSPFRLLLKRSTTVRVGPKSTLDIPVSFAPDEMKQFEALCVVNVRKMDGTAWPYTIPINEENHLNAMILPANELHEIRWLYPINGVTESVDINTKPAIVECQARSRIEERIEVTLCGVAPSASGQSRTIRTRAITPKHEGVSEHDGVLIGEGNCVAKHFCYDIQYENQDQKRSLEHCIALSLIRQERDGRSGIFNLVFNIIFSPYIQMKHDVTFVIKSATGGIWKYPLRFQATEPNPDDTITLEAAGLNKSSSVGIRLTSQTKHPASYQAFLLNDSDPEFSISPASGELPPADNQGTLLIVTFLPQKYGKVYRGKLVVQTSEMQWTYSLIGNIPEYTAPRTQSTKPGHGQISRSDKRNYILSNIKLSTTAVSSPIKGAPVIQRRLLNRGSTN